MKMFLGLIILMTLLTTPVYSQYEGGEDFEAIETNYTDESVDLAYLPEFQENIGEAPLFDDETDSASQEDNISDPEVAYE